MGNRLYVNSSKMDSSSTSSKSLTFGSSDYLVQRLSMLSLFIFAVGVVSMLGRFVIAELSQVQLTWESCRWVILAVSFVLYLSLKFVQPKLSVVKALAFVFQIFTAYVVATLEFSELHQIGGTLGVGISKVCIVCLIFPLFVHGSIRKNLILTSLSAAMIPLGYWLNLKAGMPAIASDILYQYYFLNFIICTASVIPTSSINRFEKSLNKAKAVGSYEFLEDGFIGKGGMGEVWKAKHSMLLRPAAIKIFNKEISFNEDALERRVAAKRFKREAQAIAALESPHTVDIYDVGTCQKDFAYYYAMEFLDGLDLKRFITKYGPMPPERVVFLLKQICHSLHNAHENNMIHRDIKPANILVCRYGSDYDFIKVLDFGLVKLIGSAAKDDTHVTQANISSGTPAFIAPEMALSQPVDSRTDIYSLGCVAFWMLTGQLVFEADTAVQLAVKHIQEKAPDVRSRSEFNIPDRLAQLINSCLEKSPDDRPQSITQIFEELKDVEASMERKSKWNYEKAKKWWVRHKPTHSAANPTQVQTVKSVTSGDLFESQPSL